MSRDDMPSSEVNLGNGVQRVKECQTYATNNEWEKFDFLYPHIAEFQKKKVKVAGKMENDEFTSSWFTMRATSVDLMLRNLESSQTFDDFMVWMQRLSDVIADPKCLWNIIHTDVQTTMKVTVDQSRQITEKFFTPEMVFEFGLDSFLASSLCSFAEVNDEDDVIDIFYAAAGFVRMCNLPATYEVKVPRYVDLVKRIIHAFIILPDFDPERFVWLVESAHDHCHISPATLRTICETILKEYTSSALKPREAISRLHKLCIISTSPFIQQIPAMKEFINTIFRKTLDEQHQFTHKYIFGSFVNGTWDGDYDGKISEALRQWKIYLSNLSEKIRSKPELPDLLITDFISDSLTYFTGFYGELQPSKSRSANLRLDVFEAVKTCKEFHPGALSADTMKRMWYLLYIAAVSGAEDEDLKDVKQMDCRECEELFLGLEHDEKDFKDYKVALSRLSRKFESEFDAFPSMVQFIRKNYAQ